MSQTQSQVRREAGVVGNLSTLDRFLPVWIIAAMVAGLILGRVVPGLGQALGSVEVQGFRCRSRSGSSS